MYRNVARIWKNFARFVILVTWDYMLSHAALNLGRRVITIRIFFIVLSIQKVREKKSSFPEKSPEVFSNFRFVFLPGSDMAFTASQLSSVKQPVFVLLNRDESTPFSSYSSTSSKLPLRYCSGIFPNIQ